MNKLKPLLLFFLSLTVLASLVVYLRTAKKQPSVVFIVVDTLRSDHLGCFGYPRDTSPNIDRLAAEGATFTQATAITSENEALSSMYGYIRASVQVDGDDTVFAFTLKGVIRAD